jgi:hypothetical protein
MRGYLVAAFALSLSSATYADDLPNYSDKGTAPAAPSPPSWTGFYVGGSVDYTTENKTGGSATEPSQQPNGGFVGGYNQQSGPFVLGVEGSINSPVSRFGR